TDCARRCGYGAPASACAAKYARWPRRLLSIGAGCAALSTRQKQKRAKAASRVWARLMRTSMRPKRKLIVALLLALGSCYYYFVLLLPRARMVDAAIYIVGLYDYGGDFYHIGMYVQGLL